MVVKVTPLQLSLAVGGFQNTCCPQVPFEALTVIFAGQPVMVGGWLSITVTVKLAVEILLCISVAVYVTVVTPTGKISALPPPAALLANDSMPQLSEADGAVQVTNLEQLFASAFTVILAGILVITGN